MFLCREEEKEHGLTAVADTYDESEAKELEMLRKSVQEVIKQAFEIAQHADEFLTAHPSLVDSAPNEDIRLLLLQHGMAKYDIIFGQALEHCSEWLPMLQVYMDQRVPRTMFADLMRFVNTKTEQADLRSMQLYTIIEHFEEDMGSGSDAAAIDDVTEHLFDALKEARM